jgi:hypothetical protein
MVNPRIQDRAAVIRSRTIEPSDCDGIAQLLRKGFGPRRNFEFWRQVLDGLGSLSTPVGLPKYGYLLESGGRPVGAILLIFSVPRTGRDPDAIRCNVSSWYVKPEFRGYASFLAAQALRHRLVTYLNISPAPKTQPTVEAQGYSRYSNGVFIALPVLQRRAIGTQLITAGQEPGAPYEAFERDLLIRHAAFGCFSFWCVTNERAYPFVFRPRIAKAVVPCAQLIYCSDVADVARFAGPIGRYLFARRWPFIVIDANGALPGLVGRYFDGIQPKYFKGRERPRLGDLAYTEAAMFGM